MKHWILLASLFAGIAITLHAAEINQEAEATYSASTGSQTNLGLGRDGDVSEQNTHLQYVLSYIVPERPILRLGVGYDRYDFTLSTPGFVPGTIQSVNLVVGVDLKIGDVLIRLEGKPGLYGDFRDLNGGDFNFPLVLGLAWVVNKDLQWILGVSYDGNRSWPVIPALGVRWQMSDRWLLNMVPPNPRIEYKATDDTTLYLGGTIAFTTYRANAEFGTSKGAPQFNNAVFQYTEVRAGAGVSWKFNSAGTADFQLGYLAYRDFDFHRIGDNFESKQGAFYGQLGLNLKF